MNTIKSFQVNHTKISKGMYISRIDDDIITYDIRMVKPNTPPYLENAGLHSFEHIFATYLRNCEVGNKIVYVGPMGCRTGFYLLTRSLSHLDAVKYTVDAMKFISEFNGELPGKSEMECGNYLDHDLDKAREYGKEMYEILKNWNIDKLNY